MIVIVIVIIIIVMQITLMMIMKNYVLYQFYTSFLFVTVMVMVDGNFDFYPTINQKYVFANSVFGIEEN